MEISTKFNIGDTIFFMHDNSMFKGEVTGFDIRHGTRKGESYGHMVSYNKNVVYYTNVSRKEVDELETFATKEELVKDLEKSFETRAGGPYSGMVLDGGIN